MNYKFRREDNGRVIEVPFEVMFEQEGGFITLEDGVQARRCVHLEEYAPRPRKLERKTGTRKIVSDSMGFGQDQFEQMEADRSAHGHGGVEFLRDPETPEFYQVVCDSRVDFNRYAKHRGLVNKSGMGGVRLSTEQLQSAEEFTKRRYP